MRKYLIIILLGTTLSCEDVVELDLNNAEPTYVIEGLVTDQNKRHFVRVSQSVNFYSSDSHEPLANAIVSISDGNQDYAFVHNPGNDPDSIGYYLSENEFAGQAGNTYQLEVLVDGNRFTAEDELFPVTAIDSLTVTINEDEFVEPEVEGEFYEILFWAQEPQETEDFYLFKFYKDGRQIFDDGPSDIFFSNDELLGESINGIPTASFYSEGQVATVEMYSISNAGFIYYNDLINLLQSDGGMFGSPPVNPRTNIQGGAQGFFQTSSVVRESIVARLD